MDTEKVKATIRQLLNLANNEGAAKGEIENAMRFAARLMEQHQLKDEDLTEVDDVLLDLEKAERSRERSYYDGNVAAWEGAAAMFAAKFVGGVGVYLDSNYQVVKKAGGIVEIDPKTMKPRVCRSVVFYGITQDAELARVLYEEIRVTIAAMARLKFGGVYRGPGRSYCEGFVNGLFSQLRDDEQRQALIAQQSGGRELMVLQSRIAVVDKKMELAKQFLNKDCGVKTQKRSSGGGQHHHGAYSEGRSDGAKHNTAVSQRRRIGCG